MTVYSIAFSMISTSGRSPLGSLFRLVILGEESEYLQLFGATATGTLDCFMALPVLLCCFCSVPRLDTPSPAVSLAFLCCCASLRPLPCTRDSSHTLTKTPLDGASGNSGDPQRSSRHTRRARLLRTNLGTQTTTCKQLLPTQPFLEDWCPYRRSGCAGNNRL